MSKIDLTSFEWCELIFEGKNKDYGAYVLRQESTKRHYIALIAVLIVAVLAFVLPSFISFLTPEKTITIDPGATVFENFDKAEEEKKPDEDKPLVEPEREPPPKSSVKFTEPVIAKEVTKEEEMILQEELAATTVTIHNITIEDGSDEPDAQLATKITEVAPVVDEDKPFDYVEQMPQFPGGEKAMTAYIAKNLNYPVAAQEAGISGRVIVRFVISSKGEVTKVEIARGIHPLCDREAVRVVQSMPAWTPGRQNGVAVPVSFAVPINFVLK